MTGKAYVKPQVVSHRAIEFEAVVSGGIFPGLGKGVGGTPANNEGNFPGKGGVFPGNPNGNPGKGSGSNPGSGKGKGR